MSARRALVVLAVLGGLLLLGRALVAEPFRVASASMLPTLEPGDSVLVDKRGSSTPRRGQLVAFRAPHSGEVLLKRVVAVGGDVVGIEDGRLVVNGRPQREAYADPDAIDSVYFGPVEVRPGTMFVLGDNRANSADSRSFGAVPTTAVIGRVGVRMWPPARWGTVG